MSDPATTEPTIFNGRDDHGVDEKRRVQIPARWRPERENTQFTVILWPQHKAGTCLRVMPPPEMAKLMADIEAMPKGDTKKIALKRFIGSKSIQVTLDKAGRIVLPDEMTRAADIRNQAVLIGCLTYFEIWSPDRFANVQTEDEPISNDAFNLIG
jgi:MraZ protein